MKKFTLFCLFSLLLTHTYVYCKFTNTTNSTNTTTQEAPKVPTKETLVSQLQLIQEEIALNNKKIQLLEQLRTGSFSGNQTVTQIDATILEETLSMQAQEKGQYPIGGGRISPEGLGAIKSPYEQHRERAEAMSLMNKILKKVTLDLNSTIQDMSYLITKPLQRNPDEPNFTSLLVFLTTDNQFLLYDTNGNFLLAHQPNYKVKEFTVNPLTDEYFIATLGVDNTIKMYTVSVTQVKAGDSGEAEKPKKGEKGRFTLSFDLNLEYIYDLENNQVIPEAICREICQRRIDKGFRGISSLPVRTLRYLAVGNEDGALMLIYRNGTFKGKYEFPNAKFLTLQKSHPNPVFATDKNIGFFSPAALELAKPACDSPGDQVLRVEVDQYSPNHFFALLATGDILFYETKQASGECRVIAKKSVTSQADLYPEALNIHSLKNFIFAQQDPKGIDLVAYNMTNTLQAGVGDIDHYNISLYPFKVDQDKVVKAKYMSHRNGYSSSLIGAYFEFENGTSSFSLHELTIATKPPADWLSNIRLPIIAVAILLVVGYQIYFKKGKKPQPGQGQGRGKHIHGPNCDHEHERDIGQGRARRTKGEFDPGLEAELAKRFNMDDLDSLRREVEAMKTTASRDIKDLRKKKVTFEDDDDQNEEDDYSRKRR